MQAAALNKAFTLAADLLATLDRVEGFVERRLAG